MKSFVFSHKKRILIVGISFSKKNTTWWSNTKHRQREENLIGFNRTYFRKNKLYAYFLTIIRLRIGIMYNKV